MLRQLTRPRYGTYQRGVLSCQRCASPIYVHKLHKLAEEFSVTCAKCGHRGHYSKQTIGIEIMPERRKKQRPH